MARYTMLRRELEIPDSEMTSLLRWVVEDRVGADVTDRVVKPGGGPQINRVVSFRLDIAGQTYSLGFSELAAALNDVLGGLVTDPGTVLNEESEVSQVMDFIRSGGTKLWVLSAQCRETLWRLSLGHAGLKKAP